jgi:hypothetical protein
VFWPISGRVRRDPAFGCLLAESKGIAHCRMDLDTKLSYRIHFKESNLGKAKIHKYTLSTSAIEKEITMG